jgi:hypothetical protein
MTRQAEAPRSRLTSWTRRRGTTRTQGSLPADAVRGAGNPPPGGIGHSPDAGPGAGVPQSPHRRTQGMWPQRRLSLIPGGVRIMTDHAQDRAGRQRPPALSCSARTRGRRKPVAGLRGRASTPRPVRYRAGRRRATATASVTWPDGRDVATFVRTPAPSGPRQRPHQYPARSVGTQRGHPPRLLARAPGVGAPQDSQP